MWTWVSVENLLISKVPIEGPYVLHMYNFSKVKGEQLDRKLCPQVELILDTSYLSFNKRGGDIPGL